VTAGPVVAAGRRRDQTALAVGKVPNGAELADLPIELPTKLGLIINRKTGKALGLSIPPSVLARRPR
jgi:putative ABC transport system substrate-binding protein